MGNASVKEFQDAPLGEGNTTGEKCISAKLISTEPIKLLARTKAMKKLTNYETEEGTLFASAKSNTWGTKSTLSDADGNFIGIIKVKQGMLKPDYTSIFRTTPSFEGQTPVPGKQSDDGEVLYLFAQIETKKKMKTATSTYSLVTGESDGAPILDTLYVGKTLPTFGFYVEVKNSDDVLVAKASQVSSLDMTGMAQMSAGVDMLAIALISQSVAPGGSAGALAGAGVA